MVIWSRNLQVFLNVVERHARAMSAWKRVDNTMSAAAAESARWEYDSKLKRILGGDFETSALNEGSDGLTVSEPVKSEPGMDRNDDREEELVSAPSTTSTGEEGTQHFSIGSRDPDDADDKNVSETSDNFSEKGLDRSTHGRQYYHYHNNFLDSPYFRSQTRPQKENSDDEGPTAAARQDVEETARLAQELQDEMQMLLNLDGNNTSNSASDVESSASVISYRPPSPPRRQQQHLGSAQNRGLQKDGAGGQTSTHDAITLEPIQSYDFKGQPVASVAVVASAQSQAHD